MEIIGKDGLTRCRVSYLDYPKVRDTCGIASASVQRLVEAMRDKRSRSSIHQVMNALKQAHSLSNTRRDLLAMLSV